MSTPPSPPNDADELQPPPPPAQISASLPIFTTIQTSQQSNGLKFGDYGSYHKYCTRRLRRVRIKISATNRSSEKNGRSLKYAKRPISPDLTIITKEHLEIMLFNTERAWSHAMSIKESMLQSSNSTSKPPSGRRQAFLRRLKKAEVLASAMESIACTGNVADDRTKVEATAYRGSIKGAYMMERERWSSAHGAYTLSHTLLLNLSKLPTLTRSEVEVMKDRARELEPSIRYCKYNMQGEEGEEEDENDVVGRENVELLENMLKESDKGMDDEQGSGNGGEDGEEDDYVTFRESKVSLAPNSVRLAYLRVKEGIRELTLKGTSSGEEGERAYVKALTEADDFIEVVERETERLNNSNLTPAISNKLGNLKLVASMAMHLKLNCSGIRGEQIVKHLKSRTGTSPSEFVHLYDSLLQNAREILQVGGGDDSDDFALSGKALVLRLRALRARHVGAFYEQTAQYEKAISVLGHAQNLATDAAENYQALDEGREEIGEMSELEEKVTGDKTRSIAKLYLKSIGRKDGAVSKNLTERLGKYSSCIDPYTGRVNVSSVNLLRSVYAKPTFFDIANNYAEIPRLEE
eukprot:CAMPEP_0118660850 /NCGR_PEP_ID=MMETSP0785-20121206/15933_1 /TAXON_ID=91992 /ORGANISM="Bolidomonas pacifica, Strain CCMP 1866" /LENGTH=578 /DNA_ID=CAMNT_0006554185 /DNA_START=128 /DNA_END=1861 /DNA_ORIENTATION=-